MPCGVRTTALGVGTLCASQHDASALAPLHVCVFECVGHWCGLAMQTSPTTSKLRVEPGGTRRRLCAWLTAPRWASGEISVRLPSTAASPVTQRVHCVTTDQSFVQTTGAAVDRGPGKSRAPRYDHCSTGVTGTQCEPSARAATPLVRAGVEHLPRWVGAPWCGACGQCAAVVYARWVVCVCVLEVAGWHPSLPWEWVRSQQVLLRPRHRRGSVARRRWQVRTQQWASVPRVCGTPSQLGEL